MEILWDEAKNRTNQNKHGVSFEEAQHLFTSGVEYLEMFDEEHSVTEDRFIAIGPIELGVIVVVWTEIEEEIIRIISARLATNREKRLFDQAMEKRDE
ncbi:MAG: BrnT family toxin [Thermoanaerobaculia bacterium]